MLRAVPVALLLAVAPSAQSGPLFNAHEIPNGGLITDSLFAVDWNGDGRLDLIGAHRADGQVSIALGAGDGSFDLPTFLGAPGVLDLLLADANQDGTDDLVAIEVVGDTKRIIAFLGDGAGGSTLVASAWLADDQFLPQALAATDLDADGDLDLVAIVGNSGFHPSPNESHLTTLLGDGSGGFTPTGLVRPSGLVPRDVVLGDFDEDGNVDAAVASQVSGNVWIHLGDGAGGFPSSVTSPSAGQPFRLAAGDFDQDAHLDLAVAGSGAEPLRVLTGDGAAGFTSSTHPASSAPNSVLAADMNGDGWLDLVAGYQSPLVHLNDQLGGFLVPTGCYLPRSNSLAAADLDADGHTDLAVGFLGVSVVLGDGSGRFADHVTIDEALYQFELGDLDGDGNQDLVSQRPLSGDFRVRLGNGDGTFGAATSVSYPRFVDFTLADWTGDGVLDIVTTGRAPILNLVRLAVFAGDGAGGFALLHELAPPAEIVDFDLGDLDGDGALELVAIDTASNVRRYSRAIGGGFAPGVVLPVATATRVRLADLTQDGLMDVAVNEGANVRVHAGDGSGGVGLPILVPVGTFCSGFEAFDLEGDGDVDLVARSGTRVTMMLAVPGGFAPPILSPPLGAQSLDFDLTLGDLNADGLADVALDGVHGEVLRGLPGGGWSAPERIAGSLENPALGDLDSDGFLDLVGRNQGNFIYRITVFSNRALVPDGVRVFGTGTPGCDGVQLASTNGAPDLGSLSFAYTCNHAPPSSFGLFAGSQVGLELGAPVLGILAHVNPAGPLFRLDVVQSDADGNARFPVILPSDPALAGATYTRQFVWAWPSSACVPSPLGWSTSRAVEVTLQ